jgi:hypothetical protein
MSNGGADSGHLDLLAMRIAGFGALDWLEPLSEGAARIERYL